jgi:hypothetical protein
MICTKDEFAEWKSHPVTKALFSYLGEQVDNAKDILSTSAGSNPLADKELVGAIEAAKDVLDWTPELIDEEHEIH